MFLMLRDKIDIKKNRKEELFEKFLLNLLTNQTGEKILEYQSSKLPLNQTLMLSNAKKINMNNLLQGYESSNDYTEVRNGKFVDFSSLGNHSSSGHQPLKFLSD